MPLMDPLSNPWDWQTITMTKGQDDPQVGGVVHLGDRFHLLK